MRKLLALSACLFAPGIWAAPFDECPSKAFLTQGSTAATYAVNLVTGDYNMLQRDMGTRRSMNAMGFNNEDRYLYGWSREFNVPARVHNDFKIEPLLNVVNIAGSTFYVGDMSIEGSQYYVYRPGSAYGLYKIDLDPDSATYEQMSRIVDGSTMNLKIYDMAINPVDNVAYAVDNKGKLHAIDLLNGTSQELADTGETGTFGAAYFDPDGNLYISRNKDGRIFRIAVSAGQYDAELFANGPSSSINDGSRCALAPVVDVTDVAIDFGDAPDSYGTSMEANGARHGLNSNPGLFLGAGVDGEADAYAYPLADDANDVDDEDGIQFASSLRESSSGLLIVTASDSGFLSGWVDVDRNGTFDADEQVVQDASVSAGRSPLRIMMPAGVDEGETWARFRLSTTAGLTPQGGAADGEVEDYQVKVAEAETTTNYYPSKDGWSTVGFEDNWPHEGDFDMNDLVVYLRTEISSKPAGITRVSVRGEVAAVGAAYHNGFAIRLPGVLRSDVDIESARLLINDVEVTDWSPVEVNREEAILLVTYDVWDHVGAGEECMFFRTEAGCGSNPQLTFSAELPMKEPTPARLSGVMDPFLFASPGAWHGDHFFSAPGRAYEIHMKNQEPTEAFDASLFDLDGVDVSDPDRGRYFLSDSGLPWAIEVGTRWVYPQEYKDIGYAYPRFSRFAASGGLVDVDWYTEENGTADLLFVD